MNDKTDMLMLSNNEGLSFGHLLKCLATVVSFLAFYVLIMALKSS